MSCDQVKDIPVRTHGLFGPVAGLYDRYRPRYPAEVLDLAESRLPHGADGGSLVDVGCGTGIFTRLLAGRFGRVSTIVGVEPDSRMRETAARSSSAEGFAIDFLDGNAEALPIPANSASLISAAQAAHWFVRSRFYAEAERALVDNGLLLIVQNRRRHWDSEFLSEYENHLESIMPIYVKGTVADPKGGYSTVDYLAELRGRDGFEGATKHEWLWNDYRDRQSFEAFSLTSGVTQRAIAMLGRTEVMRRLNPVLDRHADQDGILVIPYVTEAVVVSKKPT